ncbi:cystatin-like [Caretta caretta]|uniref:cystatin-like n=1 Tax=Caretta caretta TaxID=8467 RepID=UPI0020946CAB|nr:cystatin-like [Caretta caretta]
MALPAAVAGPWLCFLLLLGVPLTLGTPIAGGLQNVPVSDPEVQQAAHAAEQTYNQRSKSPYYSQGLQVLSAQRQVVSGLMLHLTMELVGTLCRKNQGEPVDLSKCPLPPPPQQKKVRCEFQIWSQPWLKRTQIGQQCNSVSH